MNDLLTLGEAAMNLGVTPSTLRVQIMKGRLRAVRRGNQWFVPMDALREYAERSQNRDIDESMLAEIYERFIEEHSKGTVGDILRRYERTDRMMRFRKGLREIAATARHDQIHQGLFTWARNQGFPKPRGPYRLTDKVIPDVFDSFRSKAGHHFFIGDAKNTERPDDEATRIRLYKYFHLMEIVASKINGPMSLLFAIGYGRKNLRMEWEDFLRDMAEHFGYGDGLVSSEVVSKERSIYVAFTSFALS